MSITSQQKHAETAARGSGTRSQQFGLLLLLGAVVALILAKWTLLVAILGLAFLITVHEFGHFVFAKLFGMRVEKFYVGFPPAAWMHTRGETEYGIGMIPLGGFCKISGMTEDETAALPEDVKPRAYFNQRVWKRNLTIFAGPLFNFLIAGVILFVFLLARGEPRATLTIDKVVPTVEVPALASATPAHPASLAATLSWATRLPPSSEGKPQEQTPAVTIGLRAGDTLLGADGQRWTTWKQAQAFFESHPNTTVTLTYRTAAGGERTSSIRLVVNPDNMSHGFLGVEAGQTYVRPYPWTAARVAVTQVGTVVKDTFKGFWWLISGKIGFSGKDGAVGPVGIVNLSQDAVRQNIYPLLLAFVSVNLGIVNLLPLLPFDGGHIFFNTIEAARRGRRVDRRVLERAVVVGTVLLMALFFFLTFNDVRRIFGG